MMQVLKILLLLQSTSLCVGVSLNIPDIDGADAGAKGCRFCPPGYGVVTVCNGTQDTVCAPCPAGTFSDKYTMDRPCALCGHCEEGYYQRTPCISTQDVRCAQCYQANGGGFGNEDFLRKCETTTTTTTTPMPTSTTPTTTPTTSSPPIQQSKTKHVDQHIKSEKNDTVHEEIEASSGDGDEVILNSGEIPPVIDENELPGEYFPVQTTTKTEHIDKVVPRGRAGQNEKEEVEETKPEENETGEVKPSTHSVDNILEVGPMLAESRDEDEGENVKKVEKASRGGGFQWPVLLAAVVAALVFFVLGILVSMCVHKTSSQTHKYEINHGDEPAKAAMIQKIHSPAAEAYKVPDETRTPIYLGNRQH